MKVTATTTAPVAPEVTEITVVLDAQEANQIEAFLDSSVRKANEVGASACFTTWDVVDAGSDFAYRLRQARQNATVPQDALLTVALGDAEIVTEIKNKRKIPAIKRLRLLTSAGLKDAKEAVEDAEVVLVKRDSRRLGF